MINVAIVEDEEAQAKTLEEYLRKFGKETGIDFNISFYGDGLDIISPYDNTLNIVFLDIQMKHLDGMTAAKKIREMDHDVVLIFVTSTVKYAVQGYAVDALGYVLKPVPYVAFSQLLEKATSRIEAQQKKFFISFASEDKKYKLDTNKILYIESQRNNVIIHTRNEHYVTLGPLKKYEENLEKAGFSKCHNAYLVNLSEVSAVKKEELILSDETILPISRARKKEFLAELTEDI